MFLWRSLVVHPDYRLLQVAHKIYGRLWGKELKSILMPVPHCGGYMYVSEEMIGTLGFVHIFYNAKVLLVREEYEISYKNLCDLKKCPGGGVVVTGQSGIGKTCFLYYLLLQLLCEKKTVAFQFNQHFFLFEETGVQMFLATASASQEIPHGTWALTDSHPDTKGHVRPFGLHPRWELPG
ncbi:hypothetical protein EI94DRAFT_104998 [Lactarius quietus]|nr:hypothetical protein EI94DRAFT_104998 [Lactarius quietus]